jgi:hypothetical protein
MSALYVANRASSIEIYLRISFDVSIMNRPIDNADVYQERLSMKRLGRQFLLTFLVVVPNIASGEVSTKVFLRDSSELLVPVEVNMTLKYVDYGHIMNGTELAIVISSDTIEENKIMSLYIEEDSRNYGVLFARGPEELGYPDSIYDAAGKSSTAGIYPAEYYWQEEDKEVKGFDLFTGGWDVNTGDWFIIDYNATAIGNCNVAFYWWDYNSVPDHGLIHEMLFTHVTTRDFSDYSQADLDKSDQVNFSDFSLLASHWKDSNCIGPGWCNGTDLDETGKVDTNDLMLFTDFWLEKSHMSQNGKVDFGDFSFLASHWHNNDCTDPYWCGGTDIDASGFVDLNDLRLFAEYWLKNTK